MTKRQRLLKAISGIGLGLAMPGLLIMEFADWLDRRRAVGEEQSR